jgi:hypothetical protein
VSTEVKSTNEVVQAIIAGSAPAPARMAAARGMLPLPQADLIEALVHLRADSDEKIAQAAQHTLNEQSAEELLTLAKSTDTAPAVLGYFASLSDSTRELHETVAAHGSTPDDAIALLANKTNHGSLLELITLNQQRLIRTPAIIDAVLLNPARTPEAERRAKEIAQSFLKRNAAQTRSRRNYAPAATTLPPSFLKPPSLHPSKARCRRMTHGSSLSISKFPTWTSTIVGSHAR